jgi:predicted protein tyrosine phosphatase
MHVQNNVNKTKQKGDCFFFLDQLLKRKKEEWGMMTTGFEELHRRVNERKENVRMRGKRIIV